VSRRPNRAREAVADEQVDVVEFPSVSPKNLVQLGEDLLRTSSTPTTIANSPTTRVTLPYLPSIYDLISGAKAFPRCLSPAAAAALLSREETTAPSSPAEVAVLVETFRKVYRSTIPVSSQSLTRLMVRCYPPYLLDHSTFPGWTHGLDFELRPRPPP